MNESSLKENNNNLELSILIFFIEFFMPVLKFYRNCQFCDFQCLQLLYQLSLIQNFLE